MTSNEQRLLEQVLLLLAPWCLCLQSVLPAHLVKPRSTGAAHGRPRDRSPRFGNAGSTCRVLLDLSSARPGEGPWLFFIAVVQGSTGAPFRRRWSYTY